MLNLRYAIQRYGQTGGGGGGSAVGNPVLFDQWAYQSIFKTDNDGFPQINLEPTPENFANPLFNSRWSGWHRMIISTTTSNGYVLGTLPVPAAQLVGGSWSLSGTDAALFSINASTGQITLSDADSVTTVENLSITVTTPAGGTYDITVPVINGTGSFYAGSTRFYDSNATGDDDGTSPTNAYQQLDGNDENPLIKYFKTGSTYTITDSSPELLHAGIFNTGRECYSYGDPSAARPRFVADAAYSDPDALISDFDGTYVDGVLDGLEFDANELEISFIKDTTSGNNITIRNCRFTNNSGISAGAIYMRNGSGFLFEHNVMDNYNGDGLYFLDFSNFLVQFNDFGAARGSGNADCGQCTDEFSSDERVKRGIIRFNAMVVDRDVNSTKGAWACEGAESIDMYGNMVMGGKFYMTQGAWENTCRDNLGYNLMSFTPSFGGGNSDNGFGYGPQQPGGRIRNIGNYSINAYYGFIYSGFKADDWMSRDRFDRADIQTLYCTVYSAVTFCRLTEAISGKFTKNVKIETSGDYADDVQGDAVLQETVDVSRSNTLVGGKVRVLFTDNSNGKNGHNFFGTNLEITVSGWDQSECNGTFDPSKVYFNFGEGYLEYEPNGTPSEPLTTSGTVTVTGNQQYATLTTDNPTDVADLDDLPTLQEANLPVLSVTDTVEEGVAVTVDYTLEPGQTATIDWSINGEECLPVHQDRTTIVLPFEPPSDYDYRFANSYVENNDLSTISCYVTVSDASGNKNIIAARWEDDIFVQKPIARDQYETDTTREGLSLFINAAKSESIRNDMGAGQDEYGVVDLSIAHYTFEAEGDNPTNNSATMNGLNALEFDGTDDCLTLDYVIGESQEFFSSHFSMFMTFQNIAMANDATIFSMGRNLADRLEIKFDSSTGFLNVRNRIDGADTTMVSTIDVSSGVHTVYLKIQQNSWVLIVDGETPIVRTDADNAGYGKRVALLNSDCKIRIGAAVDNSNSPHRHANFKLGELRLYTGSSNVVTSEDDYNLIGTAIANKYGHTWNIDIAEASFIDSYTDLDNTTTPSFPACDLGTASADRYVLVGFMGKAAGVTMTTTAATINGVTADIVYQHSDSGGANVCVFGANVPTGATGDIEVTTNQTSVRSVIQVYETTDIDSLTEHDADYDFGGDPSLTLDVPAKGFALGFLWHDTNDDDTVDWTGLDEDYQETQIESQITVSSASKSFASTQTGLAIATDVSATLTDGLLVAVSFNQKT